MTPHTRRCRSVPSDNYRNTTEELPLGPIENGKGRPPVNLDFCKMGLNIGRGTGIALIVVGALFVLLGSGILLNFTKVFAWILGKKVVLSASSQGFPIWRDVSQHLDTRVAWYFFNLKNPAEFVNGETPIVEEIGPFWYRTVISKKNIVFNANKTVSYEEHRSFEFDPSRSVSDDLTNITMLNVPLMAALNKIEPLGFMIRTMVDGVITSTEEAAYLYRTYTVRELTYGGSPSTLVALSALKEGIVAAVSALSDSNSKKSRFGFGIDKNETNPSIVNMYTGASGTNDINRIFSDNYLNDLGIWPTDEGNVCNIVGGTLGNTRAPMANITKERIYVPDMCRTVITQFEKETLFNGITVKRFNFSAENFLNSKDKPENFCYDQQYHQDSGVGEVGPCKKGAPILMSQPHFLNANPSFREKVKGMSPDADKHSFIMDHEPTTGMTVSVRGRLQANIRVIPLDLAGADNLPNVILPLFWQEMYVEGGPGIVAFLRKILSLPGIAKIALVIVILIGLILAVIGAGLLISHSRNSQRSETLTGKDGRAEYKKAPTREEATVSV